MHNFKENGEIQNKGDVEMIKKEILERRLELIKYHKDLHKNLQ